MRDHYRFPAQGIASAATAMATISRPDEMLEIGERQVSGGEASRTCVRLRWGVGGGALGPLGRTGRFDVACVSFACRWAPAKAGW